MMGPSFLFVPLVLLVPGVSSQSVVPSGLEFRSQLRKAMARAKTLLESDDVREATSYEDKFRVANFVSHLTFNATQFVLVETFGTKEGGVEKQEGWSCDFVTAREREVAPKRVVERTDTGTFGKTTSTESQRDVVTEYVWKEAYRAHYDAVDLRGGIGDEEDSSSSFQQGKKEKKKKKTRLATYVSETERAGTKRDVPPCRRGLRVEEPFIVDVTLPDADVERAPKTTPRRNPQVDRFLERIADLRRLFVFEHRKDTAFLGVAPVAANAFFVVDDAGKKDSIDSHENAASAEEEEKQPLFLQLADAGKLLGEFRRTFEEQREKSEDALAFGLAALGRLFDEYQGAVAYLEDLLFEDLRKAVGKDLTSADFDAFWDRHERANLFRPEYAPLPFSYLVRRSPTSFPDGKVALVRHSKKKKQKDDVVQRNFLLETDAEEEPEEPAKTLRRDLGERSWRVSLGAAAECAVRGETFSHAYVSHDFAEDPPSSLAVKASARQFSSFLLVLGSVLPGSSIEPSHAVVVKNRDELTIPLVLDALPSPKAFDDAIQGLSPEQRQFCLAYRRMQLSSSLVGLLIVPIEPNVERVLNLDAGSLVKEIQLTDQLVSLFVDEQISTDLLKNDDDDDDLLEDDDLKDNKATTKRASAAAKKIAVVKRRVDDVNAVLRVAVDADLSNEKKKAQYRGYAAWQQGQQSGSLDEELVEDAIPIRRSSFAARGGKERLRGGAPPFAEEAAYASTSNFALLMASSSSSSLGGAEEEAPAAAAEQEAAPPKEEEPDVAMPVAGTKDLLAGLPQRLDAAYREAGDEHLRPTKVVVQSKWKKQVRGPLGASSGTLVAEDLDREKSKAIDLLDSLSRSGALELTSATLHVLVAATHAFDETLVRTLVVDNVDPIEQTEVATAIVAATLHGKSPSEVLLLGGDTKKGAALLSLLPPSLRDMTAEE